MTIILKSIPRLGCAALLLGTAIAPAQAEGNHTYLQTTGGGSIAAPDRVASDDIKDVVTSAQIENENEVLTANFSLDLTVVGRAKAAGKSDDDRYVTSRLTNLSVKVSVPMNKAEEGSLVDFKTFGNDGKLTVGFNSYRSSYDLPTTNLPVYGEMAGACLREAGETWREEKRIANEPGVEIMVGYLVGEVNQGGSIDGAMERASKLDGVGDFGPYALAICKVNGTAKIRDDKDYVQFGEQALGKEGFAKWKRSQSSPRPSFFFGAEASIGYNRFSVVNRTTVSVDVKDRVGFDANARAGWVFGSQGMVLLASGGYTRSYKPKDVAEVCGPPDLNGNTTCVSGQDGMPGREETAYASVSLRKVLLRNKQGQPILGVRPSVTYVFEDKAWQFELPVYLQRSDSGGLDAGVRAIFNTGSDKFGLGAFVGVPF